MEISMAFRLTLTQTNMIMVYGSGNSVDEILNDAINRFDDIIAKDDICITDERYKEIVGSYTDHVENCFGIYKTDQDNWNDLMHERHS